MPWGGWHDTTTTTHCVSRGGRQYGLLALCCHPGSGLGCGRTGRHPRSSAGAVYTTSHHTGGQELLQLLITFPRLAEADSISEFKSGRHSSGIGHSCTRLRVRVLAIVTIAIAAIACVLYPSWCFHIHTLLPSQCILPSSGVHLSVDGSFPRVLSFKFASPSSSPSPSPLSSASCSTSHDAFISMRFYHRDASRHLLP